MLEVDGLVRRYGDVVALDGLTFAVRPGVLHGFVGANGAGKTTAMRAVMGLDTPDAGEVRWQGTVPDAATRRRFGYMPEERGLYPGMPADEQLVYLARLRGVDAGEARARATTWLERLGLGGRTGDRVDALSLGNQQRVQLAASLVHEPELLVLDEPFSGLDPVASDVMADVLREQAARGVPVLFSSHQLDLVQRLCEHVTVVSGGRLVADGRVEDLRRDAGGRRLRVEVDTTGRDAAWAADLPGVQVVEHDGDGGLSLALDDAVDDQQVLAAARQAGAVRVFAPVVADLAEVYRAAVVPGGTEEERP